jgi:hypothetical protein
MLLQTPGQSANREALVLFYGVPHLLRSKWFHSRHQSGRVGDRALKLHHIDGSQGPSCNFILQFEVFCAKYDDYVVFSTFLEVLCNR